MASHYTNPDGTLAADLAAAWQATEDGIVDQDARFRNWRLWVDYLSANQLPDRYLRTKNQPEQLSIVLAFAAKIRSGDLGMGAQVQLGSVSAALCHVGQMFELAGFRDPRKIQGSPELHLAVSRLYRSYKNQDPPPKSSGSNRARTPPQSLTTLPTKRSSWPYPSHIDSTTRKTRIAMTLSHMPKPPTANSTPSGLPLADL
jgi:hypothetical protein